MKRRVHKEPYEDAVPEGTPQSKRRRKGTKTAKSDEDDPSPQGSFQETDSILEQARPYLLSVARLPVEALTSTWNQGQNRRLDHRHVEDLCETFLQGNLARQTERNHILVSCSSQAIRNMTVHLGLGGQGEGSPDIAPGVIALFEDWLKINDEKLEIIAGQHRIAALREYVRRTKSPENELWWTCKIYDRGEKSTHASSAWQWRDPGSS